MNRTVKNSLLVIGLAAALILGWKVFRQPSLQKTEAENSVSQEQLAEVKKRMTRGTLLAFTGEVFLPTRIWKADKVLRQEGEAIFISGPLKQRWTFEEIVEMNQKPGLILVHPDSSGYEEYAATYTDPNREIPSP